jgi:hypothetical protein
VHHLGWGKAIEFAKQACAIASGPFGEVGDEGLDQIPAGFAEFLGAAEISGIALYESRIELMLADQKAQSISQPGKAVVRNRRDR